MNLLGFYLFDTDCHIQIQFDYMMSATNGPFGLGLLLSILFTLVSTKSGQWFLDIIHLGLGELLFTIFRYLFLRDEVAKTIFCCTGDLGLVPSINMIAHNCV